MFVRAGLVGAVGVVVMAAGLSALVATSACGSDETNTVELPDGGSVTLTVIPASATIAVGATQAFTAVATTNDGRDAEVGSFITWSSSDPTIASIDPQSGMATGVAPGRVQISARRENIIATAELVVTGAATVDGGDGGGGDAATSAALLFVSNLGGEGIPPSVRVFAASAKDDAAPLRKIEGAATTFQQPSQMVVRGTELYVADGEAQAIFVFDVTANGDVAPKRAIKGSNTTFAPFSTTGVAILGNDLFVADQTRGLLVFPVDGAGDIAPTRTVQSFIFGTHVSTSPVANEVLVAVSGPSEVKGFLVNGDTPSRTLAPGKNGARGITTTPTGIFVTTTGGQIGGTIADAVVVFAHDAQSGAAPLRAIAGSTTGLNDPHGVGVTGGEIYVTSQGEHAVRVFDETANGDVAPKRSIKGAATGLRFPAGLLIATP